ncbi:uncharacterized protein CLUP02_12721 [Colletotrichum lupini]|uniref:Uncharacterized protein n=1 Tax=Colletotrichum lupini TaxID=145971 RepID=A0A9Q8WKY6_9PEZI|nr:uncharacterized protein CLUP02_12721 [Colletotrichum lupini]UQC87219.1 hypothetical protein CLUP02_12721 [Colletotrichum lupini]
MTLISSVGVRVSFPEFSSRFAKDADVVLKDFGEMFESDCLFGARWFEAAESNIDQGASRHLAFSFLIKINNEQYIMDLVASLWRSSYLARYAHEKLEVAGAEVGSSAQHAIAGESIIADPHVNTLLILQWNAKTTRRSESNLALPLPCRLSFAQGAMMQGEQHFRPCEGSKFTLIGFNFSMLATLHLLARFLCLPLRERKKALPISPENYNYWMASIIPRSHPTTTYDHTYWKTRDPVRSPRDKPTRAGLVVGSVTTSEYLIFSSPDHFVAVLSHKPIENLIIPEGLAPCLAKSWAIYEFLFSQGDQLTMNGILSSSKYMNKLDSREIKKATFHRHPNVNLNPRTNQWGWNFAWEDYMEPL